jgi:phosphopantothenoylcysteine decarboxylase/phosphopantothenate--cysteine ligase
MAAAVADFRPVRSITGKITKESLGDSDAAPDLELERTADVLAEIVTKRGSNPRPVIVGFAAETPAQGESLLDRARTKIQRKGCDYLVANDVSAGAVFGEDSTSVLVLGPNDEHLQCDSVSKDDAAHALWDAIALDR